MVMASVNGGGEMMPFYAAAGHSQAVKDGTMPLPSVGFRRCTMSKFW
jgi:hypothetical protein